MELGEWGLRSDSCNLDKMEVGTTYLNKSNNRDHTSCQSPTPSILHMGAMTKNLLKNS